MDEALVPQFLWRALGEGEGWPPEVVHSTRIGRHSLTRHHSLVGDVQRAPGRGFGSSTVNRSQWMIQRTLGDSD